MSDHIPHVLFAGPGRRPDGLDVFIPRCESVLQTCRVDEVVPVLEAVEAKAREGFVAFGFIAYEASAAFGLPVSDPNENDFPLVWFGFCPKNDVRKQLPIDIDRRDKPFDESNVKLRTPPERYEETIRSIKKKIGAGETYQVNYTLRADVASHASGYELFKTLRSAHPVPYAAYLKTGDGEIVSLSPELFLERRGKQLASRPMKGTMRRGRTLEEDRRLAEALKTSNKNRAENVMILDMMRNDLGRVCRFGSVRSERLFHIERYPSLFQMTSEVRGTVKDGLSIAQILSQTFPAASITGAPKRRTMEIISECEESRRGVYCGSIGLIEPNGDFTFNVAIRTLCGKNGCYELGAGGGIVWDSEPDSEYREIQTKMDFLRQGGHDFSLIETLLLDSDRRYAYLHAHLDRLDESARYWDFRCERNEALRQLERFAKNTTELPLTLRITLDKNGEFSIESRPVTRPPTSVCVGIAPELVNSTDRFLYHKTTHRSLYNRVREEALKRDCFETFFINERGHVTEGCITNLFYRMDDCWYTPPVEDGLLPGVWRAHFMKESSAKERSLTRQELLEADELIIGNSVMGPVKVDEIVSR